MNDPNAEPYEKDKPNPVDLVGGLSPLAAMAYTNHIILACGELWSAFVDIASQDGDEAPEWMAEVPRAISVLSDGWLEMLETAGVNWKAATSGTESQTTAVDSVGDSTL